MENLMDLQVRRVLTHAEMRAREPGIEPAEFASIYALCVGIIMGAAAAGGMSEAEAQEARAHLMTLEIIYQITHQTTLIR
jgi:hypothetical protein